jgi:hypothetical protein
MAIAYAPAGGISHTKATAPTLSHSRPEFCRDATNPQIVSETLGGSFRRRSVLGLGRRP